MPCNDDTIPSAVQWQLSLQFANACFWCSPGGVAVAQACQSAAVLASAWITCACDDKEEKLLCRFDANCIDADIHASAHVVDTP